MLTFAGIVEPAFAEYLSSLTDVPATLETAERDSSGKVTLGLIHNCIFCSFSNGNLVTSAIQNNFACCTSQYHVLVMYERDERVTWPKSSLIFAFDSV